MNDIEQLAREAAEKILDSDEGIWESIPRREEIATKFAAIISSVFTAGEKNSGEAGKDLAGVAQVTKSSEANCHSAGAAESSEIHEHECMGCQARFDCDHELTEGICPVSDCRRCREQLHASEGTADLMPIDYYAIKNATTET